MSQSVSATLTGRLVDHENIGDNETENVRVSVQDILVQQTNQTVLSHDDLCAGDEVRLVFTVTATQIGNAGVVRFESRFDLFEGDSCTTDDEEGPPKTYSRTVLSGGAATVNVHVPGDGGGWFKGTLTLANRSA